MRWLPVTVAAMFILSCTFSEPLSEEERFYKDSTEYEKWLVCRSALHRSGVPEIHVGHTMRQDKRGSRTIRDDLRTWQMQCGQLWKELGYD